MGNAPPLTQMRAQFNSLLDAGWGSACQVTRLSGTTDSAGHVMGAYATLASSERIWIQPIAGRSMMGQANLDSQTSHLAFQKLTGVELLPKDRVLPSGATYAFDVIRSHDLETHRMSELKQDLRVRLQAVITQDGHTLALEDGTDVYTIEGP